MKTKSHKICNKKCIICGILLFLFFFAMAIKGYQELVKCDLTDVEAVTIGNNFVKSFNIPYAAPPVIMKDPTLIEIENEGFNIKNMIKKWIIIIGDRASERFGFRQVLNKKVSFGNIKVAVGCNEKEVIDYWTRGKDISRDQQSEQIDEHKAKEIIDFIASKLIIPYDVVFEGIETKGDSIIGTWIRKKNKYKYADNFISIGINKNSGEFSSYVKSYWGTDCRTDVRINKNDALKISKKKLQSYYSENEWENIHDKFDVTSAELLIIQPNAFWGIHWPLKSKTSRLAWEIWYKQKWDSPTEHRSYENTVIWIDAATGKYLGGY